MGMRSQLSLLDEIAVDNFAGGGGASTGIELASGRTVAIAINHDPDAILMHKTNHPYTEHLQASVWDVDPIKVCAGRPVGLAWFSPDCKHFSKAKGAALVDRNIRGLAWIVLRWAGTVRPRVIMLENVEEFVTWGPVRRGKPIKSKAGQTFKQWKTQLEALGYHIEHRELVAADYGAPTIRKRFVLIARCDGRPIVWPERTHAPRDSEEVRSGKCKPWRAAAEIIDWTLPAPSIFASKQAIKEQYGVSAVRPLADNTMRRIIRGVDKFTIKSGRPFLVPVGYGERAGQAPRVHDAQEPLPTVVSTVKHNACQPILTAFTATNTSNSVGTPPDEPINTARTGGGGGQMIIAPSLVQYHTEQGEYVRGQGLTEPLMTVDATPRYGLASAHLSEWYGNAQDAIDVTHPMRTQTSRDREALTLAHVVKFKGDNLGQGVAEPLQTITTSAGEFGMVYAAITKYRAGRKVGHWPRIRALLNEHCGYHLADDEILLLYIGGVPYYISDIGLRMLTPRELYAAQGFPAGYIIDHDYRGREYSKTKQVARCGNAV
ncbi:MAG: DNA cytosine methyltransferase, partial [Clostridia bacterium]|nr:DNA cytosine methyltransferase [Clostridia bacterium]